MDRLVAPSSGAPQEPGANPPLWIALATTTLGDGLVAPAPGDVARGRGRGRRRACGAGGMAFLAALAGDSPNDGAGVSMADMTAESNRLQAERALQRSDDSDSDGLQL